MDQIETAREFLERMYHEIREDYKFRGVKYNDLCDALATTIGKKLILEGQMPHLEKMIAPSTRTKKIVPVRFRGRVSWGLHVICVNNLEAWDPVLGSPIPLEDYPARLIGENLPLLPYKTTEQLEAFSVDKIIVDFS